jgi:hypothetical protein
MANKQITHSYDGMMQDISKSKYPNQFYFEGKNVRVIATDSQSTGSLTNEKGNSLIFKIPTPVITTRITDGITEKIIRYVGGDDIVYKNTEINYGSSTSGDQVIIGHANSRTYLLLFTTDDNGFDCVWKMRYDNYDITLLYLRDMNFSKNTPIQAINNFENKNIDKIYWVDGNNQLKFLNIEHSILNKDLENLIDVPVNVVDMVGKYKLTQPIIDSVSVGGSHTAGMIQYAYNLYRVNSSQTKISPLSEMIPLDKGALGGGALNEVVGATTSITISNIDPAYTNIKTYAIKYTSYNEVPSISIIDDREIPSTKSINIYDDGTIISTVSLEEFLFLGSDIIIPKHIVSKFNRLFLSNYKEINFTVDLDCRAYSFNSAKSSTIYDNLRLSGGVPTGDPFTLSAVSGVPDYSNLTLIKNDSVNLNYNTYKFQENGYTFGGDGKYLRYELTKTTDTNPDNKYFKDEEIYRIGIEFFNIYGQFSLPNWIADFKSLSGNLEGNFNTLSVTLKSDFFIWLSTSGLSDYDKPVGYKIVVAERTLNDRTIVANGILNGMMIDEKSSKGAQIYDNIKTQSDSILKMPNILQRNCNQTSLYGNVKPLRKASHLDVMNNYNSGPETEVHLANKVVDRAGTLYQYNSMLQMYSPEVLFGGTIPLSSGLKLRIKGALKNSVNNSWVRELDLTQAAYVAVHEGKAIDGLSPQYSSSVESIIGNVFHPLNRGLISHPADSIPERVTHSMFYRGYGELSNTSNVNGNTFTFVNDLVDTGTVVDVDNLIFYSDGQKGINTTLDPINYNESTVSYLITPSVGFTTVPYDVSICYDVEGNNPISGTILTGVIGTNTVFKTETSFLINPNNVYFLKITSSAEVTGTITVTASQGPLASPTYIERKTTSNPFTIGIPVVPITSYYTPSPNNTLVDIYGLPEITEKGQDSTLYNNDYKFRYSNSLKSFYSDGDSATYNKNGPFNRRIISINSYGNRCVTLVTGNNDISTNSWDRPKLESIFTSTGLTGDNNALIGELIKSDNEIYLGNIYGGNSYEDKTRSNYIEIGDYKEINQLYPTVFIKSPGDTFVHPFKFARIVKTDVEINSIGVYQLEEIVEFVTETSIDLKNRNDISLNVWDTKFSPTDAEFHKYNKVYSQLPTLIKRRNLNYTTKRLVNYDTNIVSTKLKSGGEIIDNWTDVQLNEVMTLDGKHGSINSLISFNDEVYALQDRAIAYISINPRVQTQGSDGLSIQLGTGNVLDRYKYATTISGTVNKWSVLNTSKGIYYFDLINKAYMLFKGQLEGLSNNYGMHAYFINNISSDELKIDNPLIGTGISSGFDYINNDVFMTFKQSLKESFTLSYNEIKDKFISFYDYKPSMYMSRGDYFITTSPDVKSIYRQYAGNYNTFYGVYYPSSITFNVNPEATQDCVFDNINFKSEVYLNNVDVVDKTISHIKAYNDYQDSTLVPLVLGRNNNLRRKFRDWNALIPRAGRNRIRAPFIKLKLEFNQPSNNYKFILHDVGVYYTV